MGATHKAFEKRQPVDSFFHNQLMRYFRLYLEVKSGKDYRRHSALDNVLASPNYHIPEAFVLCNDNVMVDGKVVYLPIYMTMFLLQTPQREQLIYKIQ